MKNVVRRNIELQPQAAERLDKLRNKLEASTDSEVLRKALKVLEQLVEDQEQGREFLVRSRDGDDTIVRIV
jgi:hypothetical protein